MWFRPARWIWFSIRNYGHYLIIKIRAQQLKCCRFITRDIEHPTLHVHFHKYKKAFVKHEKKKPPIESKGYWIFRTSTCFEKSKLLAILAINRPTSGGELDRNSQKAYLHRKKLSFETITKFLQGCICKFEKVREIPHPIQKTAGFCKFGAGFSDWPKRRYFG